MDEKILFENVAQEMIQGWEVIPTGNGYLIETDWRLPDDERIEIYVRMVGDREDLYLVTDGGNLFNFLFAHGIDLAKDSDGTRILNGVLTRYSARLAESQIVKGATEEELAQSVRALVETIKDASLLLWHKLKRPSRLH